LNRVDDTVLFKPLTNQELSRIVDLQIEELTARLKERNIAFELTDEAKAFIVEASFDPVYGARPLKRYIQHQLETRIGRAIVSGQVDDGSTIRVVGRNRELQIEIA
jgi:ATP-dependent Clp protease ATP-binding subunit ClpB